MNGKLVLNKKTSGRAESFQKNQTGRRPAYSVKIEYVHATGGQEFTCGGWSGPDFDKQIVYCRYETADPATDDWTLSGLDSGCEPDADGVMLFGNVEFAYFTPRGGKTA